MIEDIDDMGPIDYIVLEFPDNGEAGEGLPLLVDLVDRRIIRILDLVFVKRDMDGSVRQVPVADVNGTGKLDLSVFEGASSGLIAQDDIDDAAAVLQPGTAAAILIYENRWAAPLAVAVRRGGGQLIAFGRIPVQAIIASLEAAEAEEAAATIT